MEQTYSFYLKAREDAVEIDAAKIEDDDTRVRVLDERSAVVGVFAWSELQGYTVEF